MAPPHLYQSSSQYPGETPPLFSMTDSSSPLAPYTFEDPLSPEAAPFVPCLYIPVSLVSEPSAWQTPRPQDETHQPLRLSVSRRHPDIHTLTADANPPLVPSSADSQDVPCEDSTRKKSRRTAQRPKSHRTSATHPYAQEDPPLQKKTPKERQTAPSERPKTPKERPKTPKERPATLLPCDLANLIPAASPWKEPAQSSDWSPEQPLRPRNAFIFFRRDFMGPKDGSRMMDVSRLAGAVWGSMSESERAPWVANATRESLWHQETYPQYKYKPSKRKPKSGSSTTGLEK